MSVEEKISAVLSPYFPGIEQTFNGDGVKEAMAGGVAALESEEGGLSWARLNQILHRCSQAGVSEGCFRYYFLETPVLHPYPVGQVFGREPYVPPAAAAVVSVQQFEWGLRRFVYDAMLWWGCQRRFRFDPSSPVCD